MKLPSILLLGFLAAFATAEEDQLPIVPPDLKPEDVAKLKDDAPKPQTEPPKTPFNEPKPAANVEPTPPAPPALPPLLKRDPRTDDEEAPEDRIEAAIQQSADYYEQKQRAKSGGALFEAAEILEKLAEPRKRQVAAEADALRMLALDAARGQLNGHKVDLAAARAYVRLSSISHQRSLAAMHDSKERRTGELWYRATVYLDRAVGWAGYGLRGAGEETLTESLEVSAALAQGEPTEPGKLRRLNARTGQMIDEVGRSLAAKASAEWDGEEDRESANEEADPGFLDGGPPEVVRKARTGVIRLGEMLKRWGSQR